MARHNDLHKIELKAAVLKLMPEQEHPRPCACEHPLQCVPRGRSAAIFPFSVAQGFAERKVLLLLAVIQRCRECHAEAARQLKVRPPPHPPGFVAMGALRQLTLHDSSPLCDTQHRVQVPRKRTDRDLQSVLSECKMHTRQSPPPAHSRTAEDEERTPRAAAGGKFTLQVTLQAATFLCMHLLLLASPWTSAHGLMMYL